MTAYSSHQNSPSWITTAPVQQMCRPSAIDFVLPFCQQQRRGSGVTVLNGLRTCYSFEMISPGSSILISSFSQQIFKHANLESPQLDGPSQILKLV